MRKKQTRRLDTSGEGIVAAAALLASGGLVALPTETVYGLGADATDGAAVAGIYEAKGRPSFNPLIAHVPDLASAERLALFDPISVRLANAFWPGPLTLVLPRRPDCPVSELATAGLDTLAIRVPDHPVARRLLEAVGRPVAAPSANRSGHVSPTTADHVLVDLDGRIDAVVDGGPTRVGVESTIVAVTDGVARILRPGGIARAAIEAVVGAPVADGPASDDVAPLAPGMLTSHYAPAARVRLDAAEILPGEALLAFGPVPPPGAERAVAVMNLSPAGDLVEAAANLFGMLRALDGAGTASLAVAPIPAEGLGEAIRDRLARAAAPRGDGASGA
ncbi:L-threonylcarbamoyladenylate synthase [Oharaeibacter diazotrophicus]|uniref:Threonylcarbamoyl-AMP synthase n=1 Tax=Oharaeibacter diazotrophicus TaxID=1920512 RepID=A0A4V3CVQ0_9HYPH|nr:L-threonylcarbamoyladenylate synthase [Oharaeibacter diazotrophicus]TDP83328.1 translation factor SUA5 [Oharaeibacter diazotrophicus]BBE72161.1 threonylcarbamoyl-AMP synthase [Pleomorphomonas sp. SM30]GLS78927.1 threonylcarbamoyl-AMP synthase [Oharaeibacter diazotrophicus]